MEGVLYIGEMSATMQQLNSTSSFQKYTASPVHSVIKKGRVQAGTSSTVEHNHL